MKPSKLACSAAGSGEVVMSGDNDEDAGGLFRCADVLEECRLC